MFWTLMMILHIIVCILMILMILLQSGKGADIGAVFGGGSSNTVFGSAGPGTFLSKLTIGGAIMFMVTSITLSYFSGMSASTSGSVVQGMGDRAAQTAPATPAKSEAPAKSETPVTTPAKESSEKSAQPETGGQAAGQQ